jgi:hypothetical protein
MTKREKAIQKIEYFIPDNVDWSRVPGHCLTPLKLSAIKEDPKGTDSHEAFFAISEKGQYPSSVTDIGLLASLISGQRWMATHKKMWSEGFAEGTLSENDFIDEPDYIKSML